ncbi:hypothetical protein [Clostridium sp. E02]|uniref:hypothetical protein n=1 Tax=Clostridium sp. E02 TaxID=2487134 RepID=UPI000F51F9BB|nr:hypothetical protein [Clostridium sp. E02]
MLGDLDIIEVYGRLVYDSCANLAVEAEVILENGAHGRASVSLWGAKQPEKSAELINNWYSEAVLLEDAADQNAVDRMLIKAKKILNDPTGDFGISALSMAIARAAGAGLFLPLYRYLGGTSTPVMPVPMMSLLCGENIEKGIGFCEILVVPENNKSFSQGLLMGTEIYQTLKRLLTLHGYETAVGRNGGFTTDMKNIKEVLHCTIDAFSLTGYKLGVDARIAIDADAEELYVDAEKLYADGMYLFSKEFGTSKAMVIELERAETVSNALEMVRKAKKSGCKVIFSNGIAATEETFLSDIAAASGADYIRGGAPCRGECTAKYNQLIRIEEHFNQVK